MADTVSSTILENGNQRWAYRFTSFSDGTGEAAVTKVDGSSGGPLGVTIAGQIFYPGLHITIDEIRFQVVDMSLRILWDATSDQDAVILSPGADTLDYRRMGGIFIPSTLAGATGKIQFTTVGQQVNSSYSVVMQGKKGIRQ